MTTTMTIKEVSELLNIPEHTIRYYTDIGLIPGMQRLPNNYRVFSEESLEWLRGTVYFRQLGLSIKDIIHYHDLCFSEEPEALKERYLLLQKYTEQAEEELDKARKRLEYLKHITERDRRIAENLMEDKLNPYRRRSK
ncbi:MAG TPA: MerR family transcriptional regulator [Erysipelotrichaceae bacterium]|nr:MerR family transcriptional regulator [Erysipelotrichaceae bacterium]